MNGLRIPIVLYGVLDIVNGVQGYLAMAKMPWLVWNAGFGAFAIAGAMIAGSKPRLGYAMAAAVGALDALFFGLKLMKTPALWPEAVITVAAVAAFLCAAMGFSRVAKQRR